MSFVPCTQWVLTSFLSDGSHCPASLRQFVFLCPLTGLLPLCLFFPFPCPHFLSWCIWREKRSHNARRRREENTVCWEILQPLRVSVNQTLIERCLTVYSLFLICSSNLHPQLSASQNTKCNIIGTPPTSQGGETARALLNWTKKEGLSLFPVFLQ